MPSYPNKINLKRLSEKELGYLLGLFIGDGYCHYNPKDRHYNVDFYFDSEKNKKIIMVTKELLDSIGLRCFLLKDKRFNCIRIRVSSKNLMFYLQKQREYIINLENINQLEKDYRIGIVSGFIDAEGSVNKSQISVSQVNRNIIFTMRDLCDSLNIRTSRIRFRNNWKSNKKIGIMGISTTFKYINHNSLKVKLSRSRTAQP